MTESPRLNTGTRIEYIEAISAHRGTNLGDDSKFFGMCIPRTDLSKGAKYLVKLVIGPWRHGQEIADGSTLGPLRFGSDTALYFREHVLRPFLAQYLEESAAKAGLAT